MADHARAILDGNPSGDEIAGALSRVTGMIVSVAAVTEAISCLTVGEGEFQWQSFYVVRGEPEAEGSPMLKAYACGPAWEAMEAVAGEFGGQYMPSEYDEAWRRVERSGVPGL